MTHSAQCPQHCAPTADKIIEMAGSGFRHIYWSDKHNAWQLTSSTELTYEIIKIKRMIIRIIMGWCRWTLTFIDLYPFGSFILTYTLLLSPRLCSPDFLHQQLLLSAKYHNIVLGCFQLWFTAELNMRGHSPRTSLCVSSTPRKAEATAHRHVYSNFCHVGRPAHRSQTIFTFKKSCSLMFFTNSNCCWGLSCFCVSGSQVSPEKTS